MLYIKIWQVVSDTIENEIRTLDLTEGSINHDSKVILHNNFNVIYMLMFRSKWALILNQRVYSRTRLLYGTKENGFDFYVVKMFVTKQGKYQKLILL